MTTEAFLSAVYQITTKHNNDLGLFYHPGANSATVLARAQRFMPLEAAATLDIDPGNSYGAGYPHATHFKVSGSTTIESIACASTGGRPTAYIYFQDGCTITPFGIAASAGDILAVRAVDSSGTNWQHLWTVTGHDIVAFLNHIYPNSVAIPAATELVVPDTVYNTRQNYRAAERTVTITGSALIESIPTTHGHSHVTFIAQDGFTLKHSTAIWIKALANVEIPAGGVVQMFSDGSYRDKWKVEAVLTNEGYSQIPAPPPPSPAPDPTYGKIGRVEIRGEAAAGQVLKATSATAASWQDDETGGGTGGTSGINSVNVAAATSPYNLSTENADAEAIKFTGSRSEPLIVNLPGAGDWTILNKTGQSMSVRPAVGAQKRAAVRTNQARRIFADGTDIWFGPELSLGGFKPDVGATANPANEYQTNALVALPFSDGAGTTAIDLLENQNATIEGASWVEADNGSALQFDGVNDSVSLGDVFGGDLSTSSFTIFARVKWASDLAQNSTIFRRGADGSGNGWNVVISALTTGALDFSIVDNSTTMYSATEPAVSADTWHDIAVVYDRTAGGMKLYVDGVEVATGSAPSGLTLRSSGVGIRLGILQETGGDPFNGQMDYVRIWDAALTGSQIEALSDNAFPDYP